MAETSCPFEKSGLRLTLDRIEFTRPDGSPLQAPIAAALADLRAPSGQQPITAVCDVRDAANEALRRGGWVASVQIPAQEIADGVLRLQVVTARIVDVRVRGDAGRYEPFLRRRIAAIQALDPLNEREAERILLLAGDVPGLDVALSLRPSNGEAGTVIGDLTVSSRHFALFANAQNYNSSLLGRETVYGRGEIYGLTGLGDITYLGASTTTDFQEQVIVQGGHILQLDDGGTTLGGRATYAWSLPDLGALDLRTNTLIAGLDLARPLFRSVRGNARVRFGLDFVDQISRVGGGDDAVTLTRDKLRVLFAGIDADQQFVNANGRPWLSVSSSLEVRKGLSLFDASQTGFASGELTSRLEGNSRALVVRGVIDTTLSLGPIFSIAAIGQMQWANDPLLNYEEFALGSLTIGRGYDPGSNSGDRALGGHVEARADMPLVTGLGTQVYGFYDHLYLTNLDRARIEGARNFDSVGGGVRVSFPNRLVLDVGYAKPLDRALRLDKERPPARVLVSLTVQFRDGAR
ncbi:ShlB/FhaC/HecB family hemolysin secretion/activation protein [Sphingomonas sp. PAMC26645]|uniref:ShlB/FhaC/HecB family hemolysin secretion/activation protein n=1 Tax=Sphingomonas sp. PAMC26645 TaxID=2565555 RepID=UPI00109D86A8|nr:ShlB/FhaC/HecB family hemolysin secretion/activation protein [Sphingomonas sp. PAMC26645]QCB43209.1 ShlB/FhaC/HecB family hemolysin secretion/activation protein [Sphingomonas sp. PAMC26645]